MNRTEIEAKWNTLSDRERDAWVAEVIFDDDVFESPVVGGVWYANHNYLPNYSTDISAAIALLDAVGSELYIYREKVGRNFVVSFGYSTEDCPECGEDDFEVKAQGKGTLPEAICLAALIAKLENGEVSV